MYFSVIVMNDLSNRLRTSLNSVNNAVRHSQPNCNFGITARFCFVCSHTRSPCCMNADLCDGLKNVFVCHLL